MAASVQLPPPPSFSPKAIDRVLLTATQLSEVLGINIASDPADSGTGALTMNSSSYGTSDHSAQVTPRSCVGVVFTGEHDVYGPADPLATKVETYQDLYGSSETDGGPYLLEQAAAVLSSAEQAQEFLTSSQAQWETCSRSVVDAHLGYENSRGYTLGTVQRHENVITVAMAAPEGEQPGEACQQALGVRENVVVEARTCTIVHALPGTSNPGQATDDAERVATAMLRNVTL